MRIPSLQFAQFQIQSRLTRWNTAQLDLAKVNLVGFKIVAWAITLFLTATLTLTNGAWSYPLAGKLLIREQMVAPLTLRVQTLVAQTSAEGEERLTLTPTDATASQSPAASPNGVADELGSNEPNKTESSEVEKFANNQQETEQQQTGATVTNPRRSQTAETPNNEDPFAAFNRALYGS
jgi:hypothetical protein